MYFFVKLSNTCRGYPIIFFNKLIILTNIPIKYLLKIKRWRIKPNIIPTKIYPLNSPLLKVKMLNKRMHPVTSQNRKSCTYVIMSFVLKLLRKMRNMSNTMPITIPVKINSKKMYNWFKLKFQPPTHILFENFS